ncbi:hypothetical protein M569_09212 [Genlisea aurea]|uniref:RRM domain-containing protein n=1 Tax=Genlisea aurea TaxID=192259 RepID=S8DZU0_9LAMI|nr:hypothetical protein M569_09212 [Genlisea aurea]
MSHPPAYDAFYLAAHAQPADYADSSEERSGINTLFISGLPDDVKAREIHNLFRRRPGFASCQLKYTGRGNQVVAFATFSDHRSAMASLHALNGVKFDPQTGSTLHVELARSNSRRNPKRAGGPYVVIDKRVKSSDAKDRVGGFSDEEGSDENRFSVSGDTDSEGGASNKRCMLYIHSRMPLWDCKLTMLLLMLQARDGACSTLFIANLGPNCTDEELRDLLSQCRGFNSLKLRSSGGMPVAFADFERVEHATMAMDALQGISISSSDRGGMHIEYARSKMRKP